MSLLPWICLALALVVVNSQANKETELTKEDDSASSANSVYVKGEEGVIPETKHHRVKRLVLTGFALKKKLLLKKLFLKSKAKVALPIVTQLLGQGGRGGRGGGGGGGWGSQGGYGSKPSEGYGAPSTSYGVAR